MGGIRVNAALTPAEGFCPLAVAIALRATEGLAQ
jgi:hypothetical protein